MSTEPLHIGEARERRQAGPTEALAAFLDYGDASHSLGKAREELDRLRREVNATGGDRIKELRADALEGYIPGLVRRRDEASELFTRALQVWKDERDG